MLPLFVPLQFADDPIRAIVTRMYLVQEEMFLNCPLLQFRLPIVNYPTYSLIRNVKQVTEF